MARFVLPFMFLTFVFLLDCVKDDSPTAPGYKDLVPLTGYIDFQVGQKWAYKTTSWQNDGVKNIWYYNYHAVKDTLIGADTILLIQEESVTSSLALFYGTFGVAIKNDSIYRLGLKNYNGTSMYLFKRSVFDTSQYWYVVPKLVLPISKNESFVEIDTISVEGGDFIAHRLEYVYNYFSWREEITDWISNVGRVKRVYSLCPPKLHHF